MAQTFSGFNVPQKWDARANYQGGQGGQLVTHALITWRALRPRNGVPPGTISGQWEQVPDTITSPAQTPTPGPTPTPKPVPPAPKPTPPLTATLPLSIVSNNISVAVMTPSGDGARSGIVGAPPDTPGTSLFWREDATWAAAGGGGGGTVTSVALTVPAEFSVSGSPVTTAGTLAVSWNSEAQNLFIASPDGSSGAPSFRAIVAADLPNTAVTPGSYTYASITVDQQGRLTAASSGAAPTGTVTSVAMTVPTELSVGGSPITTSGTLALSWNNESANKVFSGPTTGSPATPTFRSLVAADLPNTAVTPGSYTYSSITVDAQGRLTAASSGAAPTGTVTSVALTVPTAIMSVAGSPITTSGTLAVSLATQSANLVWAGPTTGSPAVPTFRALVYADISALAGTSGTSFAVGNDTRFPASVTGLRKGAGVGSNDTAAVAKTDYWDTSVFVASGASHAIGLVPDPGASSGTTHFLREDATWAVPPNSGGTVTSIALTAPTEITVGGSPITTSGTIALTWTNESANVVFAGPSSGGAATPTFRTLVAADMGSQANNVILAGPVSGGPATAAFRLAQLTDIQAWLGTQTANTIFAGPTSGGAASPTFRAAVAADLPSGIIPVTTDILKGSGTSNQASALGSQSANLVLASPDGSSGVMTPRALVAGDLPAGSGAGTFSTLTGLLNFTNSAYYTIVDATPTVYTLMAVVLPPSANTIGVMFRTDSGLSTNFSSLMFINASSTWAHQIFDSGTSSTKTAGAQIFVSSRWNLIAATATNGGNIVMRANGFSGTGVGVTTLWTGGDRWAIAKSCAGASFWPNAIAWVGMWSSVLSNGTIDASRNNGPPSGARWLIDFRTGSAVFSTNAGLSLTTTGSGFQNITI